MSETTKNSGEKLSVGPAKLTLKPRVEQGVVRQSFSHGRSKAVVVEKVKRRVGPGEARPEPVAVPDRSAAPKRATVVAPRAPAAVTAAPSPAAPAPKSSGVVLRTLTDDERSARAQALAGAQLREHEERERAEGEARARRGREEIDRAERAAAEARKLNEEVRRKHDEETKRKADEVAKKRFGADATPVKPGGRPALEADEEEAPRTARRGGSATARPAPAPKPTRSVGEKRRGRLTVVTALSADEVRERSVASFRRRVQRMTGHRDEPKEKIAREPHGRTRRRRDPHPDAAGSHGEDHRHDRRRHRSAYRRGARPHRAARRRIRRRRRHVRCAG
jgi:translation initiation factor IF-2